MKSYADGAQRNPNPGRESHDRGAIQLGWERLDEQCPAQVAVAADWPQEGDSRWVWTSRYANRRIADSGLVPVRASRGYPRFKLAYRLSERLPDLAPARELFGLDDDEFDRRYVAQLDAVGVAAILEKLDRVRATNEGRGLVILCFEDLRSGNARCHRTTFAAWLADRTGLVAPELAS